MNKDIAEELFSLTREYCAKLNQSLAKVQDTCSQEDFEWYRTAVAHVMAYAQDHIMEPLIKRHQELEPDAWKGEDKEAEEFGRRIRESIDARRKRER